MLIGYQSALGSFQHIMAQSKTYYSGCSYPETVKKVEQYLKDCCFGLLNVRVDTKVYKLNYYEGDTYYGANLKCVFLAKTREQLLSKIYKYLLKNTKSRNGPVNLIDNCLDTIVANEEFNLEDEDLDEEALVNKIIVNLFEWNDTMYIEELETIDVIDESL